MLNVIRKVKKIFRITFGKKMEVLLKKGEQCSDNLLEIQVYQFRYQNIVSRALPLPHPSRLIFIHVRKKISIFLL